MRRSWTSDRLMIWAGMLCALALSGCAGVQTSGIDPTGDRVFAAPPPPAGADRSNERYFDQPLGQLPWDDVAVEIQPREIVAAVGSEVVLIGGVCGPDGYLRTNRRLEWSIDPGSVGQFVAVGESGLVDLMLGDFNRPRKITNTFAIGSTSRSNTRLNRGTCISEENVYVLRGQGWISLTSPVEGTSHVTVFAPEVYRWDARLRSAMVHWVDAQWRFPPPAINPAGTKHVFTTTVTRQSNQSPCERWRVRYEIVDGPQAGFLPDGASSVEVPTDSAGQASVEIFQKEPKHGTNKVCIQVIRPGDLPGTNGQRLIVGSGTTMKTWTGADLAVKTTGPATASPGASLEVRVTGPSQATVGSQATFEITVRNLSQAPAAKLVIKDRLDPGLEHPAANQQNAIERMLGDLAAGELKRINVTVRVAKSGRLCHTVEVTGPGLTPASAQACLVAGGEAAPSGVPPFGSAEPRPEAGVPPPALTVKKSCPNKQLVVGETAKFSIELTNTGSAALRNLKVLDRYDPALVPVLATDGYQFEGRWLAWTIDNLPPGKTTQLGVHCTCQTAAAKTCNRVSVTAPDGVKVEDEACLEIRAAGAAPAETTPPPPPAGQGLTMSVVGMGQPVTAGRELTYVIQVTNNGSTPHQQVSLTATVPEGMTPVPLRTVGPGPTKFAIEGQAVRFEPVFEVRPGESLMYRIRVHAKQPGQFRFRAELSTPALPQPLIQEATPTEVFEAKK